MSLASSTSTLSVAAESPQCIRQAEKLASELGLSLVELHDSVTPYVLVTAKDRLEIRATGKPPRHGPVYIDFTGGKANHRRQFGGGRGQPLARAIGLSKGNSPRVIDATAGLGSDAFVLASLGCKVRLIEQNAAIAALLQDGLRRAHENAQTQPVSQHMQLYCGEAQSLIPTLTAAESVDVIYLDPMYPVRDKSAAVKKEMQMLQVLAGKAIDNTGLLECALRHALKRVVVKRPAGALPLAGIAPHSSIKSPNTRYDIYMPIVPEH